MIEIMGKENAKQMKTTLSDWLNDYFYITVKVNRNAM